MERGRGSRREGGARAKPGSQLVVYIPSIDPRHCLVPSLLFTQDAMLAYIDQYAVYTAYIPDANNEV